LGIPVETDKFAALSNTQNGVSAIKSVYWADAQPSITPKKLRNFISCRNRAAMRLRMRCSFVQTGITSWQMRGDCRQTSTWFAPISTMRSRNKIDRTADTRLVFWF